MSSGPLQVSGELFNGDSSDDCPGEGEGEGEAILDDTVEELLGTFADLDTNHDGGLSLDEVRAIYPASEESFNELDTNGDGVLSTAELRDALSVNPPPDGCQCPLGGNKSSWKDLWNQLFLGGAFLGLLMLGGRYVR